MVVDHFVAALFHFLQAVFHGFLTIQDIHHDFLFDGGEFAVYDSIHVGGPVEVEHYALEGGHVDQLLSLRFAAKHQVDGAVDVRFGPGGQVAGFQQILIAFHGDVFCKGPCRFNVLALFADAGKRGPMTYIENVLVEGLKYKPETYSITLDGNETEPYKAFLVSVANASQYGNDAYIAPKASMSDGLLDVVIMEPFDIIDAPQVGLDLINKTLDKSSKIRSFKAKDIHITRSKPGVIHFDGDPIMEGTDLHVQLKSKGIRIIINEHADKSRRKPNVMQSAISEFFNELITVRDDLTHPVLTMKSILKKV